MPDWLNQGIIIAVGSSGILYVFKYIGSKLPKIYNNDELIDKLMFFYLPLLVLLMCTVSVSNAFFEKETVPKLHAFSLLFSLLIISINFEIKCVKLKHLSSKIDSIRQATIKHQ